MKRPILVILAIVVSACATPEPRVDNNAGAYNNRGVAYYFKGEYKKAWVDVSKAQSLGGQVNPKFLDSFRKASGRQE